MRAGAHLRSAGHNLQGSVRPHPHVWRVYWLRGHLSLDRLKCVGVLGISLHIPSRATFFETHARHMAICVTLLFELCAAQAVRATVKNTQCITQARGHVGRQEGSVTFTVTPRRRCA